MDEPDLEPADIRINATLLLGCGCLCGVLMTALFILLLRLLS